MISSPDGIELATAQTVLVVEDEVLIRMTISGYLRDCGYRALEAANADEALIILQEPELEIEAVLSDIEMPGAMDGFGLAQWVRANRPGLEIVLVGTPERAANAAADLCEEGPTQRATGRGRPHQATAGRQCEAKVRSAHGPGDPAIETTGMSGIRGSPG